jgi:hypothetical protein
VNRLRDLNSVVQVSVGELNGGALAPALMPTVVASLSQMGSMSLVPSMRYAGIFSERAVSARRVELEEFFEPTMRMISESFAISATAFWRLVVA